MLMEQGERTADTLILTHPPYALDEKMGKLMKTLNSFGEGEGILTWEEFMSEFGIYYKCEPAWRKQIIEGNVDYYSIGALPASLPWLVFDLRVRHPELANLRAAAIAYGGFH
jgi:hypothetical protein